MTRAGAYFSNSDAALRQFWHPVAVEAALPDSPHQVWLLDEPWVLVQLDGELVAFRDQCPHRLVPLSEGRRVGNRLECKYHGYQFDASGRCVFIPALGEAGPIPARAQTATASVRIAFGLVWLAVGADPRPEETDEAPFLDPAMDTFLAGPFTTRVSAALLTDNFMDVTHLPFLHAKTFGAYDTGRPELRASQEGLSIRQSTPALLADAQGTSAIEVTYDYIVRAPFSAELQITYPDASTDYIWSFCQPETSQRTTWYMVQSYSGLGHDSAAIAEATKLQQAVGLEDLSILESMPTPQLPIDLRAEVHTRADRGCVRYRKMLRELSAATLPASTTLEEDHGHG
jgi:phenylpropionate dioxygenase-like ring-hydroxylating dioxygenase large terminal subunit